jgi:hypothetical protein
MRYPVLLLFGLILAGVWSADRAPRSRSLHAPPIPSDAAVELRGLSTTFKAAIEPEERLAKLNGQRANEEVQPPAPATELQSLRHQYEIQRVEIAALKALIVREQKLNEDLKAEIAKRDQKPPMLETLEAMWRDDGWGFLGLVCIVGQLSVWGGQILLHLVKRLSVRSKAPATVSQTSLT